MTQPDPLAAKIYQLRTLLVNATDFSEPMDYFFDVLMVDPDFRKAGKALVDKHIQGRFNGVLEILHRQLVPSSTGKAQLMLGTWLPKYQLAHGACGLDGYMGVVFYFRDLDMGLSALASITRMSEVMFSRFSVYDQVAPSKTLHIDRSHRRH
jgi:hypothetical protein